MEKVIEYHQCGKLLNDYAAEIESLRAQLAEERQQKHEALHREYCRREELNAQLLATQANAARLVEVLRGIAKQTPEKPDYWSSCGQCEHNISDAEEALSTPINLDALHEDRARECDRLMQVMNKSDDEAVDMLDIHDVVRILQGEAEAHRAKKEAV